MHAMTIGCSSGGQATILRRPSTSSATFIVSIHRCLPLTSWISPVAWSNLRETTCISTGEPREAGNRRQRLFQANLQACMHDIVTLAEATTAQHATGVIDCEVVG